jgi:hypothetical protein
MASRSNSGVHRALGAVGVIACLLGLLTLLVFPLLRAHHFTARLRAPQALSQIQRHIFVAQPKAGPDQRIADFSFFSAPVVQVETVFRVRPGARYELASPVYLPRLLMRLKLGRAGNSGPDPLL